MKADLFAATRPNDLPPRWDGSPVEWAGWQFEPPPIVCPPPKVPECCVRCASIAPQPCNRGTVRINPKLLLENRRTGRVLKQVTTRLAAFRCTDCGHDQVLEIGAARWWDLDPDDYLDEGSYADDR